jgi:hypothetical protein
MKKIKKFFEENGFELKFIATYSRKQYRCRYSCLEDKYKVTKDNKAFELIVKITGKKLYMMYEENEGKYKFVTGGDSQCSFIDSLEYYIEKNK